MSSILVVNSGSSSFKYQLIDMSDERALATGLVERIGEAAESGVSSTPEMSGAPAASDSPQGRAVHTVHPRLAASAGMVGSAGSASNAVSADSADSIDKKNSAELNDERYELTEPIPDHATGFRLMLEAFAAHGPSLAETGLSAVGHRVVHGGSHFVEPTLITDEVREAIIELAELAPLHNPGAVQGIDAARAAFPQLPQVAVFDTAFHQTLPPESYSYAIDAELAARYRIRRYGFHGTSHRYVSREAAAFVDRPVGELKQIVLHLGNGASACAIDGGRSIDTSMGMTPLAGLVMGTRSGDLDPAVLIHLARRAGMSIDALDELLNNDSGLLGLTGHSDVRDVEQLADEGEPHAQLAMGVMIHRLRSYIGAYFAVLGRVDVISFTAGVGEHSPAVRAGTLAGLQGLGIECDTERNEAGGRGGTGIRRISSDASRTTVLVVPTNEEVEIARQTHEVTESS